MQSLQRKPRVFLSHSKKDVDFIRRLEADLRACQCETWIDEVEIRHGKPWLEEIFSTGLPSCEIVLCYITKNSAQSAMVKKEVDARLIERLANDHVALLMYVSDAKLRTELRVDLQALQIPILNEENYAQILPRIVAEIWRSYTDAAVAQAAQSEKVRRLELELKVKDLESASQATIFSAQEQAEFSSIWKQIDISFETRVQVFERNSKSIEAEGICVVGYARLFRQEVCDRKIQPSSFAMTDRIGRDYLIIRPAMKEQISTSCSIPFDYESQLLRFGFLQRLPRQEQSPNDSILRVLNFMHDRFEFVFTAKFDRFCFWLESSFGPVDARDSVVIEVKPA